MRQNSFGAYAGEDPEQMCIRDRDARRPGKFAAAVECEREDPLETALRDGKKLCTRDVFSQKHTEIGRHVGRGTRDIRKNGARKGCVRVEYELFCFSARIQQDVDFVARGLDDFVDFSAAQLFVEFSRDVAPVSYTHLDVYKRQHPDRGGSDAAAERGMQKLFSFARDAVAFPDGAGCQTSDDPVREQKKLYALGTGTRRKGYDRGHVCKSRH